MGRKDHYHGGMYSWIRCCTVVCAVWCSENELVRRHFASPLLRYFWIARRDKRKKRRGRIIMQVNDKGLDSFCLREQSVWAAAADSYHFARKSGAWAISFVASGKEQQQFSDFNLLCTTSCQKKKNTQECNNKNKSTHPLSFGFKCHEENKILFWVR